MNLLPVTPGLLWLLENAPGPAPEHSLEQMRKLEIGPLLIEVYEAGGGWRLEIHQGEKQLQQEDYTGSEGSQIPGDVRQLLHDYRQAGLFEAVDPKEFMAQAPDMREFLVNRFQKYAEHAPTSWPAEYGFVINFFTTASIPTIRSLVERTVAEAGQKMEDVSWNLRPEHDEEKPMRRDVRVVFRQLQ